MEICGRRWPRAAARRQRAAGESAHPPLLPKPVGLGIVAALCGRVVLLQKSPDDRKNRHDEQQHRRRTVANRVDLARVEDATSAAAFSQVVLDASGMASGSTSREKTAKDADDDGEKRVSAHPRGFWTGSTGSEMRLRGTTLTQASPRPVKKAVA